MNSYGRRGTVRRGLPLWTQTLLDNFIAVFRPISEGEFSPPYELCTSIAVDLACARVKIISPSGRSRRVLVHENTSSQEWDGDHRRRRRRQRRPTMKKANLASLVPDSLYESSFTVFARLLSVKHTWEISRRLLPAIQVPDAPKRPA